MVSRTHQIDGLLDALSDKGAVIVRTRLAVKQMVTNKRIHPEDGKYLLELLETEVAVSSPQSS